MEQDKEIVKQLSLFVSDIVESGSFVTFDKPLDIVPTTDSAGQSRVKVDVADLDLLKMQLIDISERTDLPEDRRLEAANAYHCFKNCLKNITFEFSDDSRTDPPEILYEIVDVRDYRIYQNPNSPDYLEYIKQLTIYNQLQKAGEPIPGPLLAFCKEAETRLFEGEKNERARQLYMQKLVEHFLETPAVQYAILSIFYSPAQVTELLDRLEADGTKQRKLPEHRKGRTKQTRSRPKKTPERTTYRKAGHYVDEVLKRIDRTGPPATLRHETEQQIKKTGVERSSVIEGIRLNGAEYKLVDSLALLLHKKSQTSNPEKSDYYAGNGQLEIVDWGVTDEKDKPVLSSMPYLIVSLYELTKIYKGDGEVTGKDTANVYNTLKTLTEKPFLIRHTEITYKANGSRRERSVESYRPLVVIDENAMVVDYDANNVETSRREELKLMLSPLFNSQIETKFVEYPSDINARMMAAYGKPEVPESTYLLREYLMNEKSHKRSKSTIDEETLFNRLCPKWMKEGRKARVTDYVKRAIDTMQTLGLVTSVDIVKGVRGQTKYVFNINTKWQ